jgi:hypothetical protein
MGNTAGAVMSANDPTAQGQWNTLWIAEMFREMSTGFSDLIDKPLAETWGKVFLLRTAFETTPQPVSGSNLVGVARSASESAALLAEVHSKALRSMGSETLDNMARIQVSFHGALASVTEPGRRAASALLDAANLMDDAEREVDLATESLSVPSGHVLINAPKGQ